MPRQKFPRYYNKTDFGLVTTDVDVVAGKFIEVLSLQVPAQQEIAWGIGAISGGVDFRKNVTIKLIDTSTDNLTITGVYRIALANANKTDIRIVMEDRSENMGASGGVPLAETGQRAKEDSYLLVYFQPDTSDTIDSTTTNMTVLLPATVYQ